MRMAIKNIKAPFKDDNIINTILNDILKPKLNQAAIKYKAQVFEGEIIFEEVDSHKIFVSSKENKIVLADDDTRIKSLGRNYLNSNRLTQKQFKRLVEIFNGSLDKLGISADMMITSEKEDHVLREGITNHGWPVPKSFPTEA